MEDQKCGTCRFWKGDGKDEDLRSCRRYPPVFTHVGVPPLDFRAVDWPSVLENDWCGEWRETFEVERLSRARLLQHEKEAQIWTNMLKGMEDQLWDPNYKPKPMRHQWCERHDRALDVDSGDGPGPYKRCSKCMEEGLG